jgi:predicted nucleic acid-binding protein
VILVDSNVLIDVMGPAQAWADWSRAKLAALLLDNDLAVNQVAFAEVAPRMGSVAHFRVRLAEFEIAFEPFAAEAAFEAGRAFLAYRSRHREAKQVLPDFFIGGHAAVASASIVTRDPRFYRTYFSSVPLITPEQPAP